MERVPRDQLERAARLYKSNRAASQALGIALGSFRRACQRYGIETPYDRKRKLRQMSRSIDSGSHL